MKSHYNVIVAGGGFAGVAAAVSAARSGMNVLLVEPSNALGGAASNGLVNPFMPYFTHREENGRTNLCLLSGGIFTEITSKLVELTKKLDGENSKYIHQPIQIFNEEYLKIVLNRIVAEAGVEVAFHTSVISAERDGGKIGSVTLFNIDGQTKVSADMYIDATGDAVLTALAGFPTRLGRESDNLCQPMTLCFRVAGIDENEFYAQWNGMQAKYKQMRAEGKIKNPREDILVFRTTAPGILHFNTTRIVKRNPTNAADVTDAEFEAREQVLEMIEFLKENAGGFENAHLISTALHIGVRESRMIDGEYTLTQEDLLSCRKFADGIAACNYEIDIHSPDGSGTSHWFFPKGEYYTIPYRTLIPRDSDNLLVAGRCISGTHEAQASYRIMPTVCTIGQAAGTAAAIAVSDNCNARDVDVDKLRKELKSNGAVTEL